MWLPRRRDTRHLPTHAPCIDNKPVKRCPARLGHFSGGHTAAMTTRLDFQRVSARHSEGPPFNCKLVEVICNDLRCFVTESSRRSRRTLALNPAVPVAPIESPRYGAPFATSDYNPSSMGFPISTLTTSPQCTELAVAALPVASPCTSGGCLLANYNTAVWRRAQMSEQTDRGLHAGTRPTYV